MKYFILSRLALRTGASRQTCARHGPGAGGSAAKDSTEEPFMRKAAIDLRFPRARPARWSRSTESRALRREAARPSTGHASAWVRPPSALWNSHEGARSDRAAAVQAGARTSVLSLSAQLLMGFGGGSVAIGAGIGLAAILAVGTVVLVSSRHHRRAQAEHYLDVRWLF
jgi:hypothetical protein